MRCRRKVNGASKGCLFIHLRATIEIIDVVTTEVNHSVGRAWGCFVKRGRSIYDDTYLTQAKDVRFLKAEVMEITPLGVIELVAHRAPRVPVEVPQQAYLRPRHPLPPHDADRELFGATGGDCIEATRIDLS